ncbi:MAG: hypothetical protein MUF10_20810, partial [Thermoanaerobaculaceae bacterium]|nr:hypothetical protein [Thermoanaerobaculaceae bacterium]
MHVIDQDDVELCVVDLDHRQRGVSARKLTTERLALLAGCRRAVAQAQGQCGRERRDAAPHGVGVGEGQAGGAAAPENLVAHFLGAAALRGQVLLVERGLDDRLDVSSDAPQAATRTGLVPHQARNPATRLVALDPAIDGGLVHAGTACGSEDGLVVPSPRVEQGLDRLVPFLRNTPVLLRDVGEVGRGGVLHRAGLRDRRELSHPEGAGLTARLVPGEDGVEINRPHDDAGGATGQNANAGLELQARCKPAWCDGSSALPTAVRVGRSPGSGGLPHHAAPAGTRKTLPRSARILAVSLVER